MSSKHITHSTLWQLLSQGITMLIGILSVKFVVVALSKELVGNYQTVYSYLQIFGILADFGLYAVSVRELSKARNPSVTFAALFLLRATITLISLSSAILIAWILPIFRGTPLPLGILVASLVPFFTLLSGMFRTVFQVENRMNKVFIAEVISKSIPVLLMASLILSQVKLSESENVYLLFLLFGGAGSLVLFLLSIRFAMSLPTVCTALSGLCHGFFKRSDTARMFRADVRSEALRIAKVAMPYGVAFLMTTIYRQSDVTLIALLRPHDYETQNAYYGIVMRLAEVGFLIPTFILNSMLPAIGIMERRGENANVLLSKVFTALLTIGSTISLFSYFFAPAIIRLIASESYLGSLLHFGSDTALMILAIPMFLSALVSYFFYLLLMRHRWRPLIIVTGLAALFSLLLNLWLIPLFGFIGAAITLTVTHFMVAIGLSCFANDYIKEGTGFATLLRPSLGVSLKPSSMIANVVQGFGGHSGLSRFARWFAYSLVLGFVLSQSVRFLTSDIRTVAIGGLCLLFAGFLAWGVGLVPREALSRAKSSGTNG